MSSGAPLIECHECGLLLLAPDIRPGNTAKCPRCNGTLFGKNAHGLELPVSLNFAALFLFVIANTFPFITFEMEGLEQPSILISGVIEFYGKGLWQLAGLVLIVTILIPLIKIVGTLYVLGPLHLGFRPPFAIRVFRFIEVLRPWAMMEVYLLGVIVAYVKLKDMATLELGVGVFAFVVLIMLVTWADSTLESHTVWEHLGPRAPKSPFPRTRDNSLIACHTCQLVVHTAPAASHGASHGTSTCPRCGDVLHRRKSNSIARTWALVATAAILYVPANVFPVMTVIMFGSGEADTIISGVKVLFEVGMWPVALLVFFASITVPVLKLCGLCYLLISVQRGSRKRLKDRTLMYRIIESVGRWSMIDIFMISILIALVRLGSIATIEPGIGAISFAAVVVTTMIASMTFDPRLMWDAAGENGE
ncbi:MAG: paraquat-inducible protein A [Rhodospirillales bacterium]|nr:paraquat-inducible protein A [Rhodospirillales bacterium]